MICGRSRSRDRSRGHGGVAAAILFAADFTGLALGTATLPRSFLVDRADAANAATSYDLQATTPGTAAVFVNIAADTPRIARSATRLGLLLEETRTNYLLYNLDRTHTAAGQWSGAPSSGSDTTGQADPALGTNGTRLQASSGGFARWATSVSLVNANSYVSAWYASPGGGTSYKLLVSPAGLAGGGTLGAAGVFTRLAFAENANNPAYIPCDGRNADGGAIAAGARDSVYWGGQVEGGKFVTSVIITAAVAVARAGERLYLPSTAPEVATLASNGRVSLCVAVEALGRFSDYSAAMRVWTIDASNYCEIGTDGSVTIAVGGVTNTCPASTVTWSAKNDFIEFFVAAGGSALPAQFSYRVNGGAETHGVVTGAVLGNITTAATAVDFLCSGTTKQLSGIVTSITAYASGYGPSWVTSGVIAVDAYGSSASMWDTSIDYAQSNYRARTAQSSARITTDALWLGCDFVNSAALPGAGANNHIAVVSNGTLVGTIARSVIGTPSYGEIVLPAGSAKTVEVYESQQSAAAGSAVAPQDRSGNFLRYLRVPSGQNTSVLAPATPSKRIVIAGDSISQGFDTATAETLGWGARLRAVYGGRITLNGSVNQALSTAITAAGSVAAFAAQIVAGLDTTATGSLIWLALGTNDHGLSTQTAAAFRTQYAALLTALRALTAVPIYAQSAIIRAVPAPAPANPAEGVNLWGAGNDAPGYRNATSGAVTDAAISSCTYVNGLSTIGLVAGDLGADGLHPSAAGYATYLAAVRTVTGI